MKKAIRESIDKRFYKILDEVSNPEEKLGELFAGAVLRFLWRWKMNNNNIDLIIWSKISVGE